MQVSPLPPKTIILTTKMKSFASTRIWPFACVLAALALAGCGRNDVKVYKVDANDTVTTPPPATAPAAMPTTMPDGLAAPDNSNLPKLKYTLPDGWKEKALTQMRVASFEVSDSGKTADVSVIPLGAMSGGDAANVNRWRGQVGLTPLEEDALTKLAEKVEVTGQPADLYDIAGTSPGSGDPERIIGTIFHSDTATWYFKISGDADLVEKQKANFAAFLKSVDFGKLAPPSTMDLSQLPPSHPALPGMDSTAPAAPADATDKPTWTVPADWKEGQLAQFLVAKFVIQGSGNATAAVNVSQLAGDGGGQLANLNRWRGQLGLEPETNELASPRIGPPGADIPASGILTVDYSGTDSRTGKPTRLVGSIVPQNGQTWFYKLMGDPDIVAQQKDAFIQFVQSAKYPAAQ
jgi:hypothetical protein